MGVNHTISQELLENNYEYKKLYTEHEKLEEEIRQESGLPMVNTQKLQFLKKQKLHVSDHMEVLSTEKT